MEIRHLQMVKEVAACGNLTKAADRLYLTQSALSHQLKEIEGFFNTQLFIRDKKQMLLTDAGAVVLEAAEKILQEVAETRAKVKCLTEKDAGEVRLCTECYTSYHWLSGFLRAYRDVYPKVDVKIDIEATHFAEQHLLENKIDVAILEEAENPKLNYTPLFQDEFMVIVAPDHEWAHRSWVEIDEFANQNYIMYNIPDEQSTNFKMLYKNFRPPRVYKMTLTEAILEMVKAGMGVAMLPNWVVRPYLRSGELAAVSLTEKRLLRTWYAATLKNKQLPPYTDAFIEKLASYMKELDGYAVMCSA
ncbi:LysR family transcriptional regulator for metE and metH [Larkinella arboricola]|uniref:LysR family transcriptional regulator for metE and metH n=1 Tax=Larkinella arboricola TaxID=643671 RepID=A0A327WY75_LARAB|nr:LysR family transcriptional regulator [Larkinella arboricola]RAJ97480.1 LysR family transcriptional regulator for metE and metH [Larkinella arboricola]